MFRFLVLFLALFAAAIFADNNFDEKYSQPLSEKDLTLGMPLKQLLPHFSNIHVHPLLALPQRN